MFGHNNDNPGGQAANAQHGSDVAVDGTMGSLEPEQMAPTATSAPIVTDQTPGYVITDLPGTTPAVSSITPPPAEPAADITPVADASVPTVIIDSPAPQPHADPEPTTAPPAPAAAPASITAIIPPASPVPVAPPAAPPAISAANPAPVISSDLLELKQSALHDLSPLLGHLDQTPEEKFRTTMMMIQATDDHTMLQMAYDAARTIVDEKSRAQALLDVVNEINYFTQAASTDAAI